MQAEIAYEVDDLPSGTNLKAQQVVLWASPVVALILVGLFVSFPGFFPPMSPTTPAAQVATFYQHHTGRIRLGMVGFNLCGILITPFFVLIMMQMQRMKGQSHIFAFSYLTAVVAGGTMFALANIFFAVAAFRPDRDPAIVQAYNDLAWIIFIAPIGMLVAQFTLLALAIYFDSKQAPVLPRWVAHYSLLTAVVMAPSAAAAVYRTGPLAWNGFISFWMRNASFALFVIVMFFVLRSALQQQARDEARIA
jgi:hypothetical protein